MRVIVVRSTLIITDITYTHTHTIQIYTSTRGAKGFKRSGEGIQTLLTYQGKKKKKKRILMGPIPAKWNKKKIRKWWCQDVVEMGKWEARRFFSRWGAKPPIRDLERRTMLVWIRLGWWWWLMIRMTETLIANSLVTCYQTSKAPATTLNHGCGARPQSGLEWQLGLGSEARRVYSQRMARQLGQLWSQLCVGKRKPTWIIHPRTPHPRKPTLRKKEKGKKKKRDRRERTRPREMMQKQIIIIIII